MKECRYCNILQDENEFRHNRRKCKTCERKDGRIYRRETDKAKIWAKENKERMVELQKNWYQNNKQYIRNVYNERMETDLVFKKKQDYKGRLRSLLSNDIKSSKNPIGCNSASLKRWLKFNFVSGMTWDNYGTLWNIDHVIPIYTFAHTDDNQLYLCYNWKNIRPTLCSSNRKKSYDLYCFDIFTQERRVRQFAMSNESKTYIELYSKHLFDLCAKYLVTGTSLEPIIPLSTGNYREEPDLVGSNGNK